MRARLLIAAPLFFVLTSMFCPTSSATSPLKYTLAGNRLGGHTGFSVVGLGDVTGDGVSDLAVGAPFYGTGQVRVFDGATGAMHSSWINASSHAYFGYSLAVLDVEDDGIDEIVVGVPGRSRIEVYAVGSPNPVHVWQGTPGSFLGASLAVGDVNGDGAPEVVAGAPHHAGRTGAVGIYSLLSSRSIQTFRGISPLDHYGQVVEISDVTGDGIGDVLITEALWAEHYRDGRVHVFEGGSWLPLVSLTADQVDLRFGESLTDVGDLDGDGFAEFVVGAPPALSSLLDHLKGRVYLYSGRTFTRLHTFLGEQDFDYFGRTTHLAADVLGNGQKVLMIGAPTLVSPVHVNAGRVYFYRLGDRSLLGRLTGNRRDGWFGSTLGAMGDMDNDGFDEVIVASPLENTQRGKVRVFGGRTRP